MPGTIILLLAVIFIFAAISKLRSRDAFRVVLQDLMPPFLVGPMTLFVPLIELALAIFLLSEIAPHKAVAASMVMLALFTIALAQMRRRGLPGCACFGETINTATTSSGLVRNIILIIASSFVLKEPEPISFLAPDFSTFLGRVTIVVGVFCFWPCIVALVNQRKLIFNSSKT